MKFFYTCKQAHQVISEGLDHHLNFSQKTHLAIHLGICRSCSNFKTQMKTLRLAMKHISEQENHEHIDHNSEDKK
jgi:hypothetical protein